MNFDKFLFIFFYIINHICFFEVFAGSNELSHFRSLNQKRKSKQQKLVTGSGAQALSLATPTTCNEFQASEVFLNEDGELNGKEVVAEKMTMICLPEADLTLYKEEVYNNILQGLTIDYQNQNEAYAKLRRSEKVVYTKKQFHLILDLTKTVIKKVEVSKKAALGMSIQGTSKATIPVSFCRTCLEQYLENNFNSGDQKLNEKLKNDELIRWLLVAYHLQGHTREIGPNSYEAVGSLSDGSLPSSCALIIYPNDKTYNSQCGISAETMFSLFNMNKELMMGDKPKPRIDEKPDGSISNFIKSALSPKLPGKEIKHKVWHLEIQDPASTDGDGHGLCVERYVVDGKPYYQIYNGWVGVQTIYESLVGDSLANRPMNEAQMKRFIANIKPGQAHDMFHLLFLNDNALAKNGDNDRMDTLTKLGMYKRLLLQKEDRNSDCANTWNPTFEKMSQLAIDILCSIRKSCIENSHMTLLHDTMDHISCQDGETEEKKQMEE